MNSQKSLAGATVLLCLTLGASLPSPAAAACERATWVKKCNWNGPGDWSNSCTGVFDICNQQRSGYCDSKTGSYYFDLEQAVEALCGVSESVQKEREAARLLREAAARKAAEAADALRAKHKLDLERACEKTVRADIRNVVTTGDVSHACECVADAVLKVKTVDLPQPVRFFTSQGFFELVIWPVPELGPNAPRPYKEQHLKDVLYDLRWPVQRCLGAFDLQGRDASALIRLASEGVVSDVLVVPGPRRKRPIGKGSLVGTATVPLVRAAHMLLNRQMVGVAHDERYDRYRAANKEIEGIGGQALLQYPILWCSYDIGEPFKVNNYFYWKDRLPPVSTELPPDHYLHGVWDAQLKCPAFDPRPEPGVVPRYESR